MWYDVCSSQININHPYPNDKRQIDQFRLAGKFSCTRIVDIDTVASNKVSIGLYFSPLFVLGPRLMLFGGLEKSH